jgi:hypothetical protein
MLSALEDLMATKPKKAANKAQRCAQGGNRYRAQIAAGQKQANKKFCYHAKPCSRHV